MKSFVATPTVYRSYAKVNFYLDVLDRRPDGYHNIETIFQSVDLGDELVFGERQSRVSLRCSSTEIDSGEANLVHRAAMLLKKECRCTQGVRIELTKRIPVAAGLAGGSGNAAATLVALNHLWSLGLSQDRLDEFALELGSDVPYCMRGGTIAATRRGEALTVLAPLPATWLVLVHPPISVSTSRIYNHPGLERNEERPFQGKTPALTNAIHALEAGNWRDAVFNRMESVVFAEHPQLRGWKDKLIEGGCVAAAMSGSGPTLFGVAPSRRDAQRIADSFSDVRASVVKSVPVGVERTQ